MRCPNCRHENIAGADQCEQCSSDLTAFDAPKGRNAMEASIIREPLRALNPRRPVMISPEASVAEAIDELCTHNIGCVLVGTPERVVGIFTERDVLLRVAARYAEAASLPVAEFITPDPETLEITTPIAFALNRMSLGDYRHVPVTENGRLVGVISLRDLLTFLQSWYPDLIEEPAPKN